MRETSITFTVELAAVECASCGMTFGIAKDFQTRRRNDHQNFHCPAGHTNVYNAESEAEKIRRERDRLAQRVAERDDDVRRERDARMAAERSASAVRGQMTKLQKRAANGVCPCCTRSFTNLKRHMDTKHPGFGSDKVVQLKAS